MAELAGRRNARLSVEIESEKGQMRMKVTMWGECYTILGHAEYLAGDEALDAGGAIIELEDDMRRRVE